MLTWAHHTDSGFLVLILEHHWDVWTKAAKLKAIGQEVTDTAIMQMNDSNVKVRYEPGLAKGTGQSRFKDLGSYIHTWFKKEGREADFNKKFNEYHAQKQADGGKVSMRVLASSDALDSDEDIDLQFLC